MSEDSMQKLFCSQVCFCQNFRIYAKYTMLTCSSRVAGTAGEKCTRGEKQKGLALREKLF